MKVVIAGSSKLQKEIKEWVNYWNSKPDHVVTDYPKPLFEENFDINYPGVHKAFFTNIAESDILFGANEKKNGIEGYIGVETFSELAFGVAQNLLHGKNIKIFIAHPPTKDVSCFEEINLWIRLGWISVFDSQIKTD